MKHILALSSICVIACLSAFNASAEDPTTPAKTASNTPRHRYQRKPTGGLILRETPKTVITVRDRQSVFTPGQVTEAVSKISRALNLPVYRIGAEDQRPDSRVEVVLVDELQSSGPAKTILAAPEQGWATLSTKWLTTDASDDKVRDRRLYLELIRAIGMAAGAGISMYQPCIMTLVKSTKDLDAIKLDLPGPEGIENITKGTTSFGVEHLKTTTYRMACREGWAPQPTNDVQKAIWDEVHSIPDKPLKITYDKDAKSAVVK